MVGSLFTLVLLVALTWARAIVTNECQHNVWIWSHPVTGSSHTENVPIKPSGQYQEPWRLGTPDAPGIAIKISSQADGLLRLADEIDFAYSIDKYDKSKIWVDLSLVRGATPYNKMSFHTCASRYSTADVDPQECDATDDVELVLCGTTRTMPAKDYASIEQIRACYEPDKPTYRRSSEVLTGDVDGSNEQLPPSIYESMMYVGCNVNMYDCSRRDKPPVSDKPPVNDNPLSKLHDIPHDTSYATSHATPYEPSIDEANKPGADKPYVGEPSSHEPLSYGSSSYESSSYKPSSYNPSSYTPPSYTPSINTTSNYTTSSNDSSSHETSMDAQNDDEYDFKGPPSDEPSIGIPYEKPDDDSYVNPYIEPYINPYVEEPYDEEPVEGPVNDDWPVYDKLPAFDRCQARVVYPTRRTSPKPRSAPAPSIKHREQHPSLCQVVQKYHSGVKECDEESMKEYARMVYPHVCEPQYQTLLMGFPCEEVARELRTIYPGVANSTHGFAQGYGAECECGDEWPECFCADAMGTRNIQDTSQVSSGQRVCLSCLCERILGSLSCAEFGPILESVLEFLGAKYEELISDDGQDCSSSGDQSEICVRDLCAHLKGVTDCEGLYAMIKVGAKAKLNRDIEFVGDADYKH
ncbi:hypothetical protein ACJQWK_04150 [Exserohilum turcicum]|uniref:Uncharacterized protein n=1 Tax=Exserohilum turcicum (strain 28A) TaxID=671987 RepID=R0J5V0_EXST2|nr:uncharacterized protein SETTUDRAFT_40938 [Exserohilum turcica Et28A]EOA92081.1 hypothetical protein SETTUDRAFT_40938 [Exserohilum turcica Et28A]